MEDVHEDVENAARGRSVQGINDWWMGNEYIGDRQQWMLA